MQAAKPVIRISRVNTAKMWEIVTEHIESAILNGIVAPGERFPPEREFAMQLSVSRSVLRAALKNLVERGLIRTTQGGGNYVNEVIGSPMTDPLAALLRDNLQAHLDFLEYRSEFEGRAAALAAIRATPPDIKVLSMIFEHMKLVHENLDVGKESKLDADFHMAICEATHNMVMIHVSQSMRDLMQQEFLNSRLAIFNNENGREHILNQHAQILHAITNHQEEQAERAMRVHIEYVTDTFRELERSDQRNEIAQQRLSRWEASLAMDKRKPRLARNTNQSQV